ncbi:MAG: choice-of-anchor D domain-containing protein, partial [Steroidobacteraceae bacterium]
MTTNGIRFVVHGTLLAGLAAFGCDGCGGSGGGGDTPPPPAAPAIGLSASSLTFASPAAGTTSAAQSILVTNTGTAALAISRIATAGNFTATNNCPASLAAGANCTVQVTFAPTTAGTLAGSLAITDDASGSPQSVTLAGTVAAGNPQHFIVGVDPSTATTTNATYNQPANWPSTAGPWNGKGAHFNPATQRIVFETYRADLVGGSIQPAPGVIRAAGVTSYFQAGPNTGTVNPSGTTALYVANKDGSAPLCIGCTDVQDGVNGVKIYKVSPSTTATPDAVIEQTGTIVYANQNKDLASWYPSGVWILFSVEMKTHALAHQQGNSEVGMFNDVWAVSPDGLTWVQLTDFASTWAPYFDPVAYVPYSSRDTANCATGTQYAPSGATVKYPYTSYS